MVPPETRPQSSDPVSVAPVEVEEPKAAPEPKAEVKVEKEDVE